MAAAAAGDEKMRDRPPTIDFWETAEEEEEGAEAEEAEARGLRSKSEEPWETAIWQEWWAVEQTPVGGLA